MASPHILFADDDIDIHESVGTILAHNGIEVTSVHNGRQALDIWNRRPVDLFILDRVMPVMDGLTTLKNIRLVSNTPVILLTALSSEEEIVEGLEAGASDYIIKPYRNGELSARVKACLRHGNRDGKTNLDRLEYEGLILNNKSRQVICQGRAIKVSNLEFQLLNYFMSHPGIVVTKQELVKNVWGYYSEEWDLNMIEATVARLRKKFLPDKSCIEYIQTVRGAGYRFGGE